MVDLVPDNGVLHPSRDGGAYCKCETSHPCFNKEAQDLKNKYILCEEVFSASNFGGIFSLPDSSNCDMNNDQRDW